MRSGRSNLWRARLDEVVISSAVRRALLLHWRDLAEGATGAPRRSDFDPLAVPRALIPHVFLNEITSDPFAVKILVQGAFIRDGAKQAFTGGYLDRETFGDSWRGVVAIYRRVHAEGRPLLSRERHSSSDDRSLVVDVLHLPLFSQDGSVSAVLGGLDRAAEGPSAHELSERAHRWEVLEVGPPSPLPRPTRLRRASRRCRRAPPPPNTIPIDWRRDRRGDERWM